MHSKVLASNWYSSSLACSEETVFSDRSISTNNFDSNLDSQSTVSLSQSSGSSVEELIKKKKNKGGKNALKALKMKPRQVFYIVSIFFLIVIVTVAEYKHKF